MITLELSEIEVQVLLNGLDELSNIGDNSDPTGRFSEDEMIDTQDILYKKLGRQPIN